jgi:SPP1 gp7 family putative phage head morphogenesis protein
MPTALTAAVLSWEEAEALFVARKGMPAASYYALEQYTRELGFTITKISSYQMMLRAKTELERLIASGGQLAEFELWAATQMPVWSQAYTALVFRMATFGAYSSARFEAINRPEVAKTFEVLFYDAVNDANTREEHARMNGRSWPRKDFPAGWWPPNGFNCRCEVRAVMRSMVKRLGLKPGHPLPRYTSGKMRGKVMQPDKGFTRNVLSRESQRLNLNFRLRTTRNALGAS